MTVEAPRKSLSLHTIILLGFIAGVALGLVAHALVASGTLAPEHLESFIENVTAPLGRVFLNLLLMVVIPIVFCSIALGVSQLGDVSRLGPVTGRTFLYFVATSALSAVLGLVLVDVVSPGRHIEEGTRAALLEQYRDEAEANKTLAEQERFWPDVFVSIVSRNPLEDAVEMNMLPIIFTAIVFGIALTRMPERQVQPVNALLEAVGTAMVVIVGFAMRLAPVAVPALVFDAAARFGWEIVEQLSLFLGVVVAGYLLHQFVSFAVLVRFAAGLSPVTFFRKMIPVMITAISTSSSSATLPTTIKIAEQELGVPPRLAGFVLPLGATMNMNGTSLFVAVVVLFLAQVFGVEMSLGSQLIVVAFAVLTAVGAAGVPSGSLPIIIVVLTHFGIPGEGLALVLGVERLLDMGRTVVNVTGDATAACYVAAREAQEPSGASSSASMPTAAS